MREIESQNRVYDVVYELCKAKDVSISKLCSETGLKPQTFTELKANRTKTLSLDTIRKLVKYFQISADVFIFDDDDTQS